MRISYSQINSKMIKVAFDDTFAGFLDRRYRRAGPGLASRRPASQRWEGKIGKVEISELTLAQAKAKIAALAKGT